jgi:CBS domain-containing protein
MQLAMVGTRRSVCIDRDATVKAASQLMHDQHVGELVVTERQEGIRYPAGIISAREIVTRVVARGLDAGVLTVGDILWSSPTVVRVTDSVTDTVERLCATGSESLPVVDGDGRVAGVVSMDDLLQALTTR